MILSPAQCGLASSLKRRRLGKKREAMLGRERHAHAVAGHSAEMVDQAGEAIDAVAIGIALDRLLILVRAAGEGSVDTTGEERSARAARRSTM